MAELMSWEAMVMKESLVGRDPVMEGLESCGQTHGSPGQPPQRHAVFQDLKASRLSPVRQSLQDTITSRDSTGS